MPGTFVPLMPARFSPSSPARPPGPAPAPQAVPPKAPSSPSAPPRSLPTVAAAFLPLAKPDPETPAQVVVQKEGDRITRICIQCACGHQIELACVY